MLRFVSNVETNRWSRALRQNMPSLGRSFIQQATRTSQHSFVIAISILRELIMLDGRMVMLTTYYPVLVMLKHSAG
jgi:hypothetical protein